MSAILSVSSPKFHVNCEEVVRIMKKLGINGYVTNNRTVLDNHEEVGCNAIIVSKPVKENAQLVWEQIKKFPDITCAHVNIIHSENGCVFDVFAESKCPGKLN